MVIDYFTKLIKAQPLSTNTTQQVQKLFWNNVIYKHSFIPLFCHW